MSPRIESHISECANYFRAARAEEWCPSLHLLPVFFSMCVRLSAQQGLMLAHTAAAQGRLAAAAFLSEDARYDPAKDGGVIFTRPQAVFVGLPIARTTARGLNAVEKKLRWRWIPSDDSWRDVRPHQVGR